MGGPSTELIRDTVLTAKGYALLSQEFQPGLNLLGAVRHVNSSGQGYANAGELIGGILGAFTKSLGNG